MRVGYCRVSTTKAEQDISLEGQQQQLRAAGCDEVIVERASAFKGQRKGWTHLWALVASGRVTEVLVVDQSRLSRSGDDLEFLQACALQKVTVRALTGGVIETESVGGFIQAGVFSRDESGVFTVEQRQGEGRVGSSSCCRSLRRGLLPVRLPIPGRCSGARPRAVGSGAGTVGGAHGS